MKILYKESEMVECEVILSWSIVSNVDLVKKTAFSPTEIKKTSNNKTN